MSVNFKSGNEKLYLGDTKESVNPDLFAADTGGRWISV